MDTLTTQPKPTVEEAKKAYHDATVQMTHLDAKLIDTAATLEELKHQHGLAVIRVNEARAALVDARSPAQRADDAAEPQPATEQRLTLDQRRERLVLQLVRDVDYVQDDAPKAPREGDVWLRPKAREVVKFLGGAWTQRAFTTDEVKAVMSEDHLRAITSHPEWIQTGAA